MKGTIISSTMKKATATSSSFTGDSPGKNWPPYWFPAKYTIKGGIREKGTACNRKSWWIEGLLCTKELHPLAGDANSQNRFIGFMGTILSLWLNTYFISLLLQCGMSSIFLILRTTELAPFFHCMRSEQSCRYALSTDDEIASHFENPL